jgi:hypothetical protein
LLDVYGDYVVFYDVNEFSTNGADLQSLYFIRMYEDSINFHNPKIKIDQSNARNVSGWFQFYQLHHSILFWTWTVYFISVRICIILNEFRHIGYGQKAKVCIFRRPPCFP